MGVVTAQNDEIMGRQSHHRKSLGKRTYQLASNNPYKKQRKVQKKLGGSIVFELEKDCIICRVRAINQTAVAKL